MILAIENIIFDFISNIFCYFGDHSPEYEAYGKCYYCDKHKEQEHE